MEKVKVDVAPSTPPKDESEEDLYTRLKELQRELEFVEIQEEYVKDEQKNLKIELLRAQEEVKRIQAVPLVIGQFLEMVDENAGIVSSTTGSNYFVRILSTLNRELLKPEQLRRAPPPLQRARRRHRSPPRRTPASRCSPTPSARTSSTATWAAWTCRSRRFARRWSSR